MDVKELYPYWDDSRKKLVERVKGLTESQLDWRPKEGMLSLGNLIRHIASAEDFWVNRVIRGEKALSSHSRDDFPTIDKILKDLEETHKVTLKAIADLKPEDLDAKRKTPRGDELSIRQILWRVVEHEIYHQGQIFRDTNYLGLAPKK
ncbi:MAG: DinB family protein [bacterium]